MHCVNHPETDVQSFCQSCGKPLCGNCVRTTSQGQILCDGCLAANTAAAGGDPSQAYWQGVAQGYPVPPRGTPNPAAAAVLGLIPGVGAMYNGQLFKGLIHVVIFAVLVSMAENYGVFGIFIGAWVLYQSFEAFHTAKARRDGTPIPDPFGLNEVGNWLNLGNIGRNPNEGAGMPPPPQPPPSAPGTQASATSSSATAGSEPPAYSAPYTSSWTGNYPPPPPEQPFSELFVGGYPPGSYPPGYIPPIPPMPPIPPVPPMGWRRREPVWAIVLIGLGIIFLLQSLGFVGHLFHFAWPVLLIGLGVWLIIRRVGYTQGGSK